MIALHLVNEPDRIADSIHLLLLSSSALHHIFDAAK